MVTFTKVAVIILIVVLLILKGVALSKIDRDGQSLAIARIILLLVLVVQLLVFQYWRWVFRLLLL